LFWQGCTKQYFINLLIQHHLLVCIKIFKMSDVELEIHLLKSECSTCAIVYKIDDPLKLTSLTN